MPEQFEAVAERWLTPVIRGSEEWMCACLFCPGSQSLQFNIRKGLWICFRCGKKGTAKELVESQGGSFSNPAVNTETVEARLAELQAELRDKRRGTTQRVLPETYLARFGGKPHEYWTKRRKFSRETIREWDLGFDPVGPRIYDGDRYVSVGASVTLPFRDPDGNLLGTIHRRLDNGFPRYIYPKHFDRIGSLFGSWRLSESETNEGTIRRACLVEGSTDTIRIHQAGFRSAGQYGSSLHPNQVKILRRLGVKEIVLFYDYDASGRKATAQAPRVLDGFIIRSVQWDENRFCWHGKLCNCGQEHDPTELGFCHRKKSCRCGREHDVDPGDWKRLPDSLVTEMIENAPLIGRQRKWEQSGKSRSRRRRKFFLRHRTV